MLVQQVFPAGTVVAAGRGEDEPRDARLLRQFGQAHRGQVVDLVGQVRIQIAERIVRQPRQVDDGIEAPEVIQRSTSRMSLRIDGTGTIPSPNVELLDTDRCPGPTTSCPLSSSMGTMTVPM